MSKFAQLVAVIRGVLKFKTPAKDDDLRERRDDFIRDNFRMENNGAGVIVTDSRAEYTPTTDKTTPIPAGQLDFVRKEINNYFGVNDGIIQNTATPEEMDAFYSGGLLPFYMQLDQGLTRGLFTERERGFGNRILCELDRIQFETLEKRTAAAQFLTNLGALELDQVLGIFGFAPIGGEEGKRRVQSLNMANTKIIDKYQLTSAGSKAEESPPEATPEEPKEPEPKNPTNEEE